MATPGFREDVAIEMHKFVLPKKPNKSEAELSDVAKAKHVHFKPTDEDKSKKKGGIESRTGIKETVSGLISLPLPSSNFKLLDGDGSSESDEENAQYMYGESEDSNSDVIIINENDEALIATKAKEAISNGNLGSVTRELRVEIEQSLLQELFLYAAECNQPKIARFLLEKGADPNKCSLSDHNGYTALHLACRNSHEEDITELVELILSKGCKVRKSDKTKHKQTPIHYAAARGHLNAVKLIIDQDNEAILDQDKLKRTALHKACARNWYKVVELLIELEAKIYPNKRSALAHRCRTERWVTLPKKPMMRKSEKCNMQEYWAPITLACFWGCTETVEVLLKHGAEVPEEALQYAIAEGYRDIVRLLINVPHWASLMRNTFKSKSTTTTPFREMIKHLPDVAEEILNRCTIGDPAYINSDDSDITVVYDYEFIEDTCTDPNKRYDETDLVQGKSYDSTLERIPNNHATSWGPRGFDKSNHPLTIMVKFKRLNLLTHPLVGSLLHHKWKKFGQYGYFANLIAFSVFLIFLTTFALLINNPQSPPCSVLLNETVTNCGYTVHQRNTIIASAVIVLMLSLVRLGLEIVQFRYLFLRYLFDWVNWMEVALYVCSIIFVWVFHEDCLCPLSWQWQFGVMAVFLGWINLLIFASKLPFIGIYVLMFVKIVRTFLGTLIISFLLVIAFGLTFHLTFTQPDIMRSPFSSAARSVVSLIAMTAGEFDFGTIFRLDPSGESDGAEEIPFPPISYIVWLLFVIIMPILLTNMLVGLAVGDIETVKNQAALRKLALQVEQVLTIEGLLPKKLQSRFRHGYQIMRPKQKVETEPSMKYRFLRKIQFTLWGGDKYDTKSALLRALHPHEEESEVKAKNIKKVIHDVGGLKNETQKIGARSQKIVHEVDEIGQRTEALARDVTSLTASMTDVQRQLTLILSKLDAGHNVKEESK